MIEKVYDHRNIILQEIFTPSSLSDLGNRSEKAPKLRLFLFEFEANITLLGRSKYVLVIEGLCIIQARIRQSKVMEKFWRKRR